MVWCCLLWSIHAHDAEIGGLFAGGELVDMDELHCAGARNGGCALYQAMDFCHVEGTPKVAFAAATEFSIFSKLPSVGIECITVQCPVGSD